MGYVLDKSCRENQNTNLCSITFFQKSCRLWQCRKMWWRPRGHKWRDNMAHTQPGTHMYARTHAHRPISNSYCFSTSTVIREHASMLRYTRTAPLVINDMHATLLCSYTYILSYKHLSITSAGLRRETTHGQILNHVLNDHTKPHKRLRQWQQEPEDGLLVVQQKPQNEQERMIGIS
jgi:hypothetical protein